MHAEGFLKSICSLPSELCRVLLLFSRKRPPHRQRMTAPAMQALDSRPCTPDRLLGHRRLAHFKTVSPRPFGSRHRDCDIHSTRQARASWLDHVAEVGVSVRSESLSFLRRPPRPCRGHRDSMVNPAIARMCGHRPAAAMQSLPAPALAPGCAFAPAKSDHDACAVPSWPTLYQQLFIKHPAHYVACGIGQSISTAAVSGTWFHRLLVPLPQ